MEQLLSTDQDATMPSEPIQVVTTTAERADADKIAMAILEKRLAACVQVSGPIDSSYWWNGRLEKSREWTVTIKTRRDLYAKLEKLLLATHPYDHPEIIATAIVEISAGYLKWLNEQVSETPPAASVPLASGPSASARDRT